MVEHPPLFTDFEYAPVRISVRTTGAYHLSLRISVTSAAVYDCSAVCPWPQRGIAVCISEVVVAGRKPVLSICSHPRIYEHVFVIDFPERRGFVETELPGIAASGNHAVHRLCTLEHVGHAHGIHFRTVGMFKAPVAVHSSVIIDEHCRIETEHAGGGGRVVIAPVDYLERPVRPFTDCDHRMAPSVLRVGVEVIEFPVPYLSDGDVRRKEHVPESVASERIAVPVLFRGKDDSVIAPVQQVIHGCGPYDLVPAAVRVHECVVGTVDIYPVLARTVRILEYIGLAIGDILPERKIGILTVKDCLTE